VHLDLRGEDKVIP